MSFRRQIAPLVRIEGAELDRAMSGIGMRFAADPNPYPAIEDVLVFVPLKFGSTCSRKRTSRSRSEVSARGSRARPCAYQRAHCEIARSPNIRFLLECMGGPARLGDRALHSSSLIGVGTRRGRSTANQ